MRIAVLQHVACEPPAAYGPLLQKHAEVDTYLLGRDDLPSLDPYHGVVVMGGPMGAYDTDSVPWLAGEIAALQATLHRGGAVWGVCLGAQLLAAAAGARVTLGPTPEVGVGVVELAPAAADDPVFSVLPSHFRTLQWHQDTFELPQDAQLLASSGAYPHQAFRLGRSYGVQFHLEASWELASEWLAIPAYRAAMEAAIGPEGVDAVKEAMIAESTAMTAAAEGLIGRWLELIA